MLLDNFCWRWVKLSNDEKFYISGINRTANKVLLADGDSGRWFEFEEFLLWKPVIVKE